MTIENPFNGSQTATVYEIENITTAEINSTEVMARLDDGMRVLASFWIVIAVIGFLGNTFLFLMTHNPSIKDQSYALFLSVLSIVDSIVLLVKLLHGGALLASTKAQPEGPLVPFLDTVLSCVFIGFELCARCLSAWILGTYRVT